MRRWVVRLEVGLLAAFLAAPVPRIREKHPDPEPPAARAFVPRPYFEENRGQLGRSDFAYFTQVPGREVAFAEGRVAFHVRSDRRGTLFEAAFGDGGARPEPLDPLPGRSHYLRGSDSEGWITGVRQYGRILYREVYPKIDLVYFFDPGGRLTYEFIVRPGGDPSRIELSYRGIDRLEPRGPRRMEIVTAAGRMGDGELACYQETDGARLAVASRFRQKTDASYGVELLEPHDPSRALVVDPTLSFSTYWGKGEGRTVAIDTAGNIYVSGAAGDSPWPATPGAYDTSHNSPGVWPDVGVTKFDPNGNVLWATLIGGPEEDYAYVSAVNSAGELYVGGRAGVGFPTTPGAFDRSFNGGVLIPGIHSATDGFVLKLATTGDSLVYSTFIGGSDNEVARAIHLFPSGEVVVAGGNSKSTNMPVTPGAYKQAKGGFQDAYVARLSASGSSLIFLTYFGANNDTQADETVRALGADAAGNIWIGGTTTGTDLVPTANAFQPVRGGGTGEGYIAKLSGDGRNLLFLSWLGGSGNIDEVETEGVSDAAGNFYVAGSTNSPNFPVTANAFQTALRGGWDGYLARINNDGTLGFVTLYGGSYNSNEGFFGPALDPAGNIYVTGRFRSTDCPMTSNAFQPNLGGAAGTQDSVLAVFSPDGRRLLYGTYFGGSSEDPGRHVGIHPNGSFVVLTGGTSSTNMPLLNAADSTPDGTFVEYVAKFDVSDLWSPPGSAGTLQFGAPSYSMGEGGGSAAITVTRTGGSSGAVSVNYAASNGTATAGDYGAASGTLTWNNGDAASKSFAVPIVDDPTVEPTETVNLALFAPGGGAALGSPSAVVLTIVDNDSVLPAPTGVAAMPGDGRVTVVWGAVAGATSYTLYMASAAGVSRTSYAMQHANATSPFVHTGLANGSSSFFVVTASNASGESSESIEVSATPTAGGFPIPDTDGDGYSDAAEIAAGSNPNDPLSTPVDTDGDGMADAWENANLGGLSALPGDDPDGDGAINLVEYNAGTNPNVADTDGDGFSDGAELAAGSNPLDPASVPGGSGASSGSGRGGCGATGFEGLLILALMAWGRPRDRRKS